MSERILVIGDDRFAAGPFVDEPTGLAGRRIDAEVVGGLTEALVRLDEAVFDAVVLDLTVPDVDGLGGLRVLRRLAPDVPVVVLNGDPDDAVAVAAIAEGAQDCLAKGSVGGAAVARAVRHAIQRHRMLDAVRALALVDDLTGLRNRRGLMVLAEHEMAASERTGIGFSLVFLDIDGMKSINDRFGHGAGDRLLQELAELMRSTFRDSDVLARVGGDEFCVLLSQCADEDTERNLVGRLDEVVARRNAQASTPYELRVSVGRQRFDPCDPASLECLLDGADAAMYASRASRPRIATVLVVDDDEDMRLMLELALGESYRVVAAADGNEALVRCDQHPPDLVLLDLTLGGMDGLEVARRLRSSPSTRNLPIIIMTGERSRSIELSGLRAGADDFVAKPFDLEVLSRRIGNVLNRAAAR